MMQYESEQLTNYRETLVNQLSENNKKWLSQFGEYDKNNFWTIYDTLTGNGDFSKIEELFTNSYYDGFLSNLLFILTRRRPISDYCYIMRDILKASKIYVNNKSEVSDEVISNFFNFISFSKCKSYIQNLNSSIINNLYKAQGITLCFESLDRLIEIDYSKLQSDIVLPKNAKIKLNHDLFTEHLISIGDFKIQYFSWSNKITILHHGKKSYIDWDLLCKKYDILDIYALQDEELIEQTKKLKQDKENEAIHEMTVLMNSASEEEKIIWKNAIDNRNFTHLQKYKYFLKVRDITARVSHKVNNIVNNHDNDEVPWWVYLCIFFVVVFVFFVFVFNILI